MQRRPDGAEKVVLYQRLILAAFENEGFLIHTGVEDNLTDEMALKLDADAEKVSDVLDILDKANILQPVEGEEGLYFLASADELSLSRCESYDRVNDWRKRKRQKQALQIEDTVTQCNAAVTDSNNCNAKCSHININSNSYSYTNNALSYSGEGSTSEQGTDEPSDAPEPEEAEQPLSPELMGYLNELDGRRRA